MKYFQTSDKKLFYVEDLARNHARSLHDKTVKKVDSDAESTVKKIKQALVNVVGETKLTEVKSTEKTPANKTAGKEASKKETVKEVKDNKTADSKSENLEPEVNLDKSKGSDVAATQKVDEQQKEETKTDN